MALQLHHRVVVIRFQRQIAALGIALEEPSFLQESRYTMTDGMHQSFEFINVWRFYPVKTQFSMSILNIDPIQEEHVKVQIEEQPH
jgi:hypothetical protein